MKSRRSLLIGAVLIFSLSFCSLLDRTSGARTYDHAAFSFTIPAGWKTHEEVWNRPASPGQEYKGLGVEEIIRLQYPGVPGKGKAFFTVASSPLAGDSSLEERFNQTYQAIEAEIEILSRRPFERGELSGYEILYARPWGEPWWTFRDVWLQNHGSIYLLSFQASPAALERYAETYDDILESFHFKE